MRIMFIKVVLFKEINLGKEEEKVLSRICDKIRKINFFV